MIIILGTQKKTEEEEERHESACYNILQASSYQKKKKENGLHGCEFVKRRSPQEILQIYISTYLTARIKSCIKEMLFFICDNASCAIAQML